jgi:hypothetical protein
MLCLETVEHVAEHLQTPQQFGFAFWSGHEMTAADALVNFDAFDVDLSTREGKRVGCGSTL